MTIKRLMIAIGFVAGLLGLYRSCGRVGPVLAIILFAASVLVWSTIRTRPRVAPWLFGASVILGDGLSLDAAISGYDIFAMLAIGTFGTATSAFAIGSGAAWITAGGLVRRWPRRIAWAVVLGLGLMPQSILLDPWPLRLAFSLSRPELDRLADRVTSVRGVTSPERAGLYWIVGSEVDSRNGSVALLTDAHPGGPSGFVRSRHPDDPAGPILSTAGFVRLDRHWNFRSED